MHAYSGQYDRNPYNFQSFNVSEVGLMCNGQSIPSTPYRPDFAGKCIAREYFNIFQQLGKAGVFSDDNGITMEDWSKGNTLYVFNLAPDGAVTGHAQAVRYTNVDVTIRFTQATDTPLQLIALAIYDTQLELTGQRIWLLDQNQQPN